MFSGTVKLANIDDYITPAPSCVKPLPPTTQGKLQPLTLKDCLACSGCVTSAETVLAEKQSLDAFLQLPLHNTVVGLSPQAIIHIAHNYSLSLSEAQALLSGFFKSLKVAEVCGMRLPNLMALRLVEKELAERTAADRLPVLLSECPGWVCYCEKLGGQRAVAALSRVKSPQQIFGVLAKKLLKQARVAMLMPCYDKKLESARFAYEVDNPEVDIVLTLNQIRDDLAAFVQSRKTEPALLEGLKEFGF